MLKKENINKMVHPASMYVLKLKDSKKIGSKNLAEKIEKSIEDYKKGSHFLEFAIVTEKKFLVNKNKRYDYFEVVPHNKTAKEVFIETVNELSFSHNKEKYREEAENIIKTIKSPEFFDNLDEDGHYRYEDVVEIKVSPVEQFLEFSHLRTKVILDLSK